MTATGIRLWAWTKTHGAVVLAVLVSTVFVAVMVVVTTRVYDQRQARLQVLQDVTVSGCESGNVLRTALRDYVAQTITTRPAPPGADPATAHEIETRNAAAKDALARAEMVFANRDCAALARALKNPTERTTP